MRQTIAILAVLLAMAGCTASATREAPVSEMTATTMAVSVPQSCLDALDDSDKIIEISADTMGIVSEAFDHAAELDWEKLNNDAERINAQADKLDGIDYAEHRDACRKAAG